MSPVKGRRRAMFPRSDRGASAIRIMTAWVLLALPCLHTFLHQGTPRQSSAPSFQSSENHHHTDACNDHDSDCQICVDRLNGPPLLAIADGLKSDVETHSLIFHSVEVISSHFEGACAVPRAPPAAPINVA